MSIGKWISQTSFSTLPDAVKNVARVCLLDCLGSIVVGSRSKLALCLDQTDVFSQDPEWKVFINAHAAALYDIDDGHRKAQGHPGAAIVSSVLSMAEDHSIEQLLHAIVIGYEVAVREALIFRAFGGPRKGSGGWVAPGVAASVGVLIGLNAEQFQHAIALAEYSSPQATQDRSVEYPSMMKEGIPFACISGVKCAQLALSGMTSMKPFLQDSEFANDLGKNWEISNTYFKDYACCRWAHPVLDCLKYTLLPQPGFDIKKVDQIKVFSFNKATLLSKRRPTTIMEAIYSIPFSIGCFAVFGNVDPITIAKPGVLSLPAILEIADKVQIIEDPKLTREFPFKCLERLVLEFDDGTRYESNTLSAKGDPQNPYSVQELEEKFLRITAPLMGERNREIIQVLGLGKDCDQNLLKVLTGSNIIEILNQTEFP